MGVRQGQEAFGEPWTMEGFEALQALNRARRAVWFGLVGAPGVAALWEHAVALARAFDAGSLDPRLVRGPGSMVLTYLLLGLDGALGRTGLNLVFGCLVAAAAGVSLWGAALRRNLDRRGVTARALRMERGTLLRRIDEARRVGYVSGSPGTAGARGGTWVLLQLLALGLRLIPAFSIALTAGFVWRALGR